MVSVTIRVLQKAHPKFHISTPIFYPNSKPHLGHLYTSLLVDVQSRWHKLNKHEVLFSTGTDEHGLKIQLASQKLGYKSPKNFVDTLHQHFLQLDKVANIEYSRFIRTTDQDHVENVKKLWNLCLERGYIYKGQHSGWYAVSDETFYPSNKIVQLVDDKEVSLSTEPDKIDYTGKFINTETRCEVIYHSEYNYFLKLSEFREPLIKHLQENPNFIHPYSRYKQILSSLLDNPLQDISISRPSSRLEWGIVVPNDDDQKIYVWFDALCNYITSIGDVNLLRGKEQTQELNSYNKIIEKHSEYARELWSQTTHVIGKDIARFHAVYWPGILMAAGLPLPKKLVIHGHWLSKGVKMSKSLGNVVDPIEMIKKYDTDAVRWYVLENSNLESDGDFVETNLAQTRELLCSKWGNLINRCCSSKFNIERSIAIFHGCSTSEIASIIKSTAFDRLAKKLNTLVEEMDRFIKDYDTSGATKHIWSIINDANTIFQQGEPWAKNSREQDSLIFIATESARITALVAQALIPEFSCKFLDRLAVDLDRRSLDYATLGADSAYGLNANLKEKEVPIKRLPK